MKPLDRQKLDVVNQTRSNIFGWRGQFTPDSKPIEFEGFENMANSPHLEAAQPRRCPVSIPWNSTGLEVRATAGSLG